MNSLKVFDSRILPVLFALFISLFTFVSCQQEGPQRVEVPSDEEITRSLQGTFESLQEIPADSIDISTSKGVVTLSGSVPSLLAKKKATDVVQDAHGVLSVVNNIKVTASRPDSELNDAITRKTATNPVTEFWEITSTVNNGVVTLKGVVDSWQERRLVEKLVMQVKGVKEIDNRIIVQTDETRTDQEIKQEIEQTLKMDNRIAADQVNVEVNNGEVNLSGQVGSAREQELATDLAQVVGVSSVSADRLEVHPEYGRSFFTREDFDALTNEQIVTAIQRALRYDPRVPEDSVSVNMKGDDAVLIGTVENLNAKLAAGSDARYTAGVNSVENNIEVKRKLVVSPEIPTTDEAVKERLIMDIDNHPYIDNEDDIGITVEKGVVTLSGTVSSQLEKDQIHDLANEVKGVIAVNNNLIIAEEGN